MVVGDGGCYGRGTNRKGEMGGHKKSTNAEEEMIIWHMVGTSRRFFIDHHDSGLARFPFKRAVWIRTRPALAAQALFLNRNPSEHVLLRG